MALHAAGTPANHRIRPRAAARGDRWSALVGEGVHPEDAFIAAFVARVAPACRTRAERALARALAQDMLDQHAELAQRWGLICVSDWLRGSVRLARRGGIAPARVELFACELLSWLVESKRLAREHARVMCRDVGAVLTAHELIAA